MPRPAKTGLSPADIAGGTANGGFLRKGDWVEAEKAGKNYRSWVCGLPTETTKAVGVADSEGKRIGQFSPNKVRLLARAGGFSWKEVKGRIPPPAEAGGILRPAS